MHLIITKSAAVFARSALKRLPKLPFRSVLLCLLLGTCLFNPAPARAGDGDNAAYQQAIKDADKDMVDALTPLLKEPKSPARDAKIKEIKDKNKAAVKKALKNYSADLKSQANPVGQIEPDGFRPFYPVSHQDELAGLANVNLSFSFVDSLTFSPTTGPQIGSVLYEFEPAGGSTFSLLGLSTDAASNFGFSGDVTGFDPIIRATPLDTFGQPIFISDFFGGNVAQSIAVVSAVPETTQTLGLLSGALLLMFAAGTCQRKVSAARGVFQTRS